MNMTSSSEAFEKFSIWKKLNTPLSVTVIERNQPEQVFLGRIDAIDSGASQVGILVEPREYGTFDVDGAEFSIESNRVVVSRDDLEWLIFEEAF
jgi:hypothetical protein